LTWWRGGGKRESEPKLKEEKREGGVPFGGIKLA